MKCLREIVSQAPLPEIINFCSGLPVSHPIIQMPRVEFEKKFNIQWCISQMITEEVHQETPVQDNVVSLKNVTEEEYEQMFLKPINDIVIGYVDPFVGYSGFAMRDIAPNEMCINYGGIRTVPQASTSVYIYVVSDNVRVDANFFRNYVSYFPHLPHASKLDHYHFLIPKLKDEVACQNVRPQIKLLQAKEIICMKNDSIIHANEVIGYDYGDQYWAHRKIKPFLFDKMGRIIPKFLYQENKISLSYKKWRFGNTKKYVHIDTNIAFDCIKLKRDYVDQFDEKLSYQKLKTLLMEQGYLPTTHYKNPNALDLAWELCLAAKEGRIDNLIYLLDWADEPVDVNMIVAGHTALHQAVESGEYYAVYYLVAKGAELNAMDAIGLTPYDLAVKLGKNVIAHFLHQHMR